MKHKLYIETSVVGYLTGRPSSNTVIAGHQVATQEMWSTMFDRFDPYISLLVLREIAHGDANQVVLRNRAVEDIPVLDVDAEVERISTLLVQKNAVPAGFLEDAVHIAVSSVNEMNFIVTWNFKHINNPVAKQKMRKVIADAGYVMPEICSPDELLEVGDE